jgi:hypothetical protein
MIGEPILRPAMSFLKQKPPRRLSPYTPEEVLWWHVLRQAARDLVIGSEQDALDSYDFLRSTGLWMLMDHFNLTEDEAVTGIAGLVQQYIARTGRELPCGLKN